MTRFSIVVSEASHRKRVTVPQRVFFGALALAAITGVVWGDAWVADRFGSGTGAMAMLLSRGSLIPLVTLLMCLAGAVEFVHLLRSKGVAPCAATAYAIIALSVLAPWLGAGCALGRDPVSQALMGSVFSMALGVVLTGMVLVVRRRTEGVLRDAGGTLLLIAYLGLLPSFVVHIRSAAADRGSDGAWIILGLLVVVKASDIGAYFAGTYFGRHKLIPAISPGKSIEGAVGGMILSGVVAVLVLPRLSWGSPAIVEYCVGGINPFPTFSFSGQAELFFIGLFLSLVGQIGDLLESCFKRDVGIKDSGQVLPRFGGVLDLMDSPILAMPVAWMILTLTG